MNSRGIDVVYMTASKDDPAFDENLQHLDAQFIGEGNRAFSKLNFLNATMLISTTPGLDVFQWKRSKNVDYYVHVLHAASNTCGYHMFGIDYYDAVLISGNHHERDIRALDKNPAGKGTCYGRSSLYGRYGKQTCSRTTIGK